MDQEEDNNTKLPDIKNNKGEPDAFVGPANGGSKSSNRNMAGGLSGRAQSMSRHSSKKSVTVTNNLQTATQSKKPNKTLQDAKKKRMQVEQDAELLANRIALLKQEEMRTWK